jgi:hypothetical protein
VVEVHHRCERLTEWRHPGRGPATLGDIPIEDGEVSPPNLISYLLSAVAGAAIPELVRRASAALVPGGQIILHDFMG